MHRTKPDLLSRRTALLSGLLLTLGVLPACDSREKLAFHGIDLTGSAYGRNFRLSDAQGRERTLADFKGKLVMLFFGFTQCPDVCPTALSRAVAIKELLGTDGQRLQVLFVTIDPERDTPAVIKAYLQVFDATFIGLHGDQAQTRQAADDFKVYYKKVPTASSYTMDHSTMSYVFDPSGKLRLALRHESTAQDCAADLRLLLKPV